MPPARASLGLLVCGVGATASTLSVSRGFREKGPVTGLTSLQLSVGEHEGPPLPGPSPPPAAPAGDPGGSHAEVGDRTGTEISRKDVLIRPPLGFKVETRLTPDSKV